MGYRLCQSYGGDERRLVTDLTRAPRTDAAEHKIEVGPMRQRSEPTSEAPATLPDLERALDHQIEVLQRESLAKIITHVHAPTLVGMAMAGALIGPLAAIGISLAWAGRAFAYTSSNDMKTPMRLRQDWINASGLHEQARWAHERGDYEEEAQLAADASKQFEDVKAFLVRQPPSSIYKTITDKFAALDEELRRRGIL